MSDSADILCTDNLELARRLARWRVRTLPRTVDVEDLESAAYLGLLEASRAFDPSQGVPFDGYATARIKWAMTDWMREEDHLKRSQRQSGLDVQRPFSIDQPAGGEEGGAVISDLLAGAPARHFIDDSDEAEHAVSSLSPQEQTMLDLNLRWGLVLREVGEAVGVSESRACQVMRGVRARAREGIESGRARALPRWKAPTGTGRVRPPGPLVPTSSIELRAANAHVIRECRRWLRAKRRLRIAV